MAREIVSTNQHLLISFQINIMHFLLKQNNKSNPVFTNRIRFSHFIWQQCVFVLFRSNLNKQSNELLSNGVLPKTHWTTSYVATNHFLMKTQTKRMAALVLKTYYVLISAIQWQFMTKSRGKTKLGFRNYLREFFWEDHYNLQWRWFWKFTNGNVSIFRSLKTLSHWNRNKWIGWLEAQISEQLATILTGEEHKILAFC